MNHNKPQIFMLHFAGGSIQSFDFIKKFIPKSFDLHLLELPGRGMRLGEALLYKHKDATSEYLNQIKAKRTTAPYVIYGHSMGSFLALLITEKLELLGDPPKGLVLTGNTGLGLKGIEPKPKRYLMNDKDFKDELTKLGGVPEEVLVNEELFEFFSPILRADFQVTEEVSDIDKILIKAPIQVINGTEEEFEDVEDDWSEFTESTCTHRTLSGGHFFIYDHPQEIADCILSPLIKTVI